MYTSFAVDDCETIPLTPPPCFVSIMQSPHDFLEGLELDRRRSSVGGKDKVDFPHLPREEEGGPLHRFLRQRRASNFPPVCQPQGGRSLAWQKVAGGGRSRRGDTSFAKRCPLYPLMLYQQARESRKNKSGTNALEGKLLLLRRSLSL